MRRIILICICIFVAIGCSAQENESITQTLKEKYGFACYHDSYGGWYSIKKDGKVGACSLQGNEIIPPIWDNVYFHENYYEVKKEGKVGIRDLYNKELIPVDKYDDIWYYQMLEYGYCDIMINNKRGVLSKDLKEVVPCKYDKVRSFQLKEQPYCEIMVNNKWGVYDISQQKEVIPPNKYGYGGLNNKGSQPIVAFVQMGALIRPMYFDEKNKYHYPEYINKGKCGVVELKTGKEIIPCKYDDIKISDKNLYTFNVGGEIPTIIKGDLIATAQGGKWGVVDSSNKVVIPAEYDAPIVFKDGVAQVNKNGITSLLSHPYNGTSLTFANGVTNNEVDSDIPQTNKSNKEIFAFVFANENYTNFSVADYSINDGKIFVEYCKKTWGIPEHNVRYFEDATYGNFVSAIKKIEDIANVYEGEATIVVYYSGLGTIDTKTKERYILPSDAALGSLEKTGYSVQKLIERLDALKTKGTYVLLDAPFAGTDKKGQGLTENRGIRIVPKQLSSSGSVLVCFSNSDNENSYASSQYGHGLFTYGILKKLKESKGNCSWKDLLDSSSEWVKKESLQQYDMRQTPKYVLQESNNSIINKMF